MKITTWFLHCFGSARLLEHDNANDPPVRGQMEKKETNELC